MRAPDDPTAIERYMALAVLYGVLRGLVWRDRTHETDETLHQWCRGAAALALRHDPPSQRRPLVTEKLQDLIWNELTRAVPLVEGGDDGLMDVVSCKRAVGLMLGVDKDDGEEWS